jgi:hypothetical protein
MPSVAPFAILRTEKIKDWSTLTKSMGHCLRTSNDGRMHLAPGMAEPLRILLGEADWVADWKKCVDGMWLPKLKMGTAHTIAREFILTTSPKFFTGKGKKEIDEWIKENVDWLKNRFGDDRVKFACAHFDEQTLHISAYVVGKKSDTNRKGEPLNRGNGWTLSDGILHLGGGKEELGKLQDEYGLAMQKFELRRGIKGSKATHQTTAKWRKQMAKQIDEPVVIPRLEKPTAQDQKNIEAYGKRVADKAAHAIYEQMKPYHQQAKTHRSEVNRLRGMVERLEPIAEAFKRLLERLLGHAPRLDSIEGLNAAQARINLLVASTLPKPQAVVAEPVSFGLPGPSRATPMPAAKSRPKPMR